MQEEHDFLRNTQETRARRRILNARRASVDESFRRGLISEEVLDRLRHAIDAAVADISEGHG